MARLGATHATSIIQRASGAGQFTGVIPTTAESTTHNGAVYEFAVDAVGGLFFWETAEPMMVDQVLIDLGANGTVFIYLVNLDANNLPVAGEQWQLFTQAGARYVALNETNFKYVLLPKQAIQIVSSVSASAKIAQVTGMVERAYTH
jgi:hypothetical protein